MKQNLNTLVNNVATHENPLSALRTFLDLQERLEAAKQVNNMRFVGYVLELGFDTAKIITSDPYKLAVGGIPRGSYLIMVPNNRGNLPIHFTLLRVTGVATTPLSSQVQQTYFELHKKSMPELDMWTQGELQWGALDCDVLGMFYANPADLRSLSFSGDVNNVVSAHRYSVFSPDDSLLKLIVNGTVKEEQQFQIGHLRTMENQLSEVVSTKIPVQISMKDFKGCRTAMFGKTRLGKSNVVKLIAQGMIEATTSDNSVGQLIFDVNGEYANDNNQDGSKSLRSAYVNRTNVYALTKRPNTPSKPLRLNFYEQPDSGIEILGSMLQQDNQTSNYIRSFYSVQLPSIADIVDLSEGDKTRAIRKIQIYWATLKKAGFPADESRLKRLGLSSRNAKHFNPQFNQKLRNAAFSFAGREVPEAPSTLDELVRELDIIAEFRRGNLNNEALVSNSGNAMFDPNDIALLEFFNPTSGTGPAVLRSYINYHAPDAGDFVKDILNLLDIGRTVILDLGNATDEIRRYFSEMLSRAVFTHQEEKFVNNELDNHYIQLYFEEAHNLFPVDDKDVTGVYARFAKEGAKFHIGMIYSTQSPSTINKELLAQTENFFVGHLSSSDETKSLSRVQIAFSGIENDILKAKTPGYMRMLTMSHRFVIPVQANRFEASAPINELTSEV
ncbi:ATP-binding protein [Peribacillus frigoritolerans]|uniref:ATP-binding protein n=1 Tax=Peribacillus frigoritolerans TaxID=450367 RepID=UPI003514EDFC